MTDIALTELERELLERVSIGGARFGVALDCLDEELLERSPGLLSARRSRGALLGLSVFRTAPTSPSEGLQSRFVRGVVRP
jgi:hypothetical protein